MSSAAHSTRQCLGGALWGGCADQLDPGLQQLARLSTLRAHAAIAVRQVAKAQRWIFGGIAGGDHARDRHGHVRAQHERSTGLVKDAISRLGFGHVGACKHRLVLERRRVHLAVAMALEHAAQSVSDGAHLARLVREHVPRAAGYRMDHRSGCIQADGGDVGGAAGLSGWLGVYRLCRDPLDASAELAQTLVDALVAAVDLTDVADLATPFRAQCREQHGHASANVR